MQAEIKKIIEDLNTIMSELSEIKEKMPDKEMFLTPAEAMLLEESYREEKESKLISSAELKKSL